MLLLRPTDRLSGRRFLAQRRVSAAVPALARWEPRLQGLADGAALPSITDQTGGSGHLLQASSMLQPIYESTSQAASTDGADDFNIADTPDFSELIVVVTTTADTINYGYLFTTRGAASTLGFNLRTGAAGQWLFGANGATSLTLTGRVNGAKALLHARLASGTLTASVNGGTEQVSSGATATQLSKLILGASAVSGAGATRLLFHDGGVYAPLTTAQRAAEIARLKSKWGIT